jgi:hypothetical protein
MSNRKLRYSDIRLPAASSQCHNTGPRLHAARDVHGVHDAGCRIPNSYARSTHTRTDDAPVNIPDRTDYAVRGGDGASGGGNDELLLLKLSSPVQEPCRVLPVIIEIQTFPNSFDKPKPETL